MGFAGEFSRIGENLVKLIEQGSIDQRGWGNLWRSDCSNVGQSAGEELAEGVMKRYRGGGGGTGICRENPELEIDMKNAPEGTFDRWLAGISVAR